MFAYWLHMNMLVNGFDHLHLRYKVNTKTHKLWDSLNKKDKEFAVIGVMMEEICGTGHGHE